MKYLRWQGAASFFVIFGAIALCLYLFAEPLIKKGIETSVALYTGAEVNVAEVDLAYSPLTLSIKGFEATDAEQPSMNLVAFKEAKADLHLWQYLLGKVIIDELVVDGLSFSTKRASIGEVYLDTDLADEEETAAAEGSTLADIKQQLPDPKQLLNDSDLLTVKASQALSASYQSEAEKLKDLKAKLPSKEKLAAYQEKVKALGKIEVKSLEDIEQIKAQYNELKAEFKAEQAIVKAAKEQLAASKNVLSERVTALKNAPSQDWQNIEKTYQLENIDGADFAHLLFGAQAREYYDTAMAIYQKLSPLLTANNTPEQEEKIAATGRYVLFDEENPLPEILIKKAHFSMNLPQGDLAIDVNEFTHQHWLRNLPTRYQVNSQNLNQQGTVNLLGEFTLNQQGLFNTDGKWTLEGMPLTNAQLGNSDKLSLTLKQGSLFAGGQYQASNTAIDTNNAFTIKNAQYDGKADNSMGKLVLDTVSSLDELVLKVSADGALTSPTWHVSSPLDKALKNAVSKKVDEKLTSFKADVQAGLNDKLASALNMPNDGKAQLLDLESVLNDSDNALDNLLDSDVVKQQEDKLKDKLKDKAKDKLKDKLGGFFN